MRQNIPKITRQQTKAAGLVSVYLNNAGWFLTHECENRYLFWFTFFDFLTAAGKHIKQSQSDRRCSHKFSMFFFISIDITDNALLKLVHGRALGNAEINAGRGSHRANKIVVIQNPRNISLTRNVRAGR